ncbi:MAG: DNA repair protein RadA [Rhodospirillaceae bacterium]
MARSKTIFICQDCGASFPKWSGQCEACSAWNTLIEETPAESAPKGLGAKKGRTIQFVGLDGSGEEAPRRTTGIGEFDRVCGGGLVAGSAILVGGDPGIGKSTVLLQACAALSKHARCAYITGEESIEQLRLRARRLGVQDSNVDLAAATSVRDIVATLDDVKGPDVVVIDSIQTMYLDNLDSAPGTVTQVRTTAQELIRLAKRRNFTVILVGHVTKEGQIAGPRVLEHMVDTVLYFEGERSHQFRILRSVKNRFGPANEIGVFEMMDTGLAEVKNPSALFLSEHDDDIAGAVVFAGMEGTRPMLVEIQTLIAPSALGTPRRAVIGWDSGRLAMILAVLETRCGLAFAGQDVYLNVAGGFRITEPAADLAVAAALVSAATGRPVPANTIVFGEVGLSGEVRSVAHREARIKEATKLGFTQALGPHQRRQNDKKSTKKPAADGIETQAISQLSELMTFFNITAPLETANDHQGKRVQHG